MAKRRLGHMRQLWSEMWDNKRKKRQEGSPLICPAHLKFTGRLAVSVAFDHFGVSVPEKELWASNPT